MARHYVNNADFLVAIKEHREKTKLAVEAGKEPPQVSNYLGECILKIANHLSYKPNFINYSYKEEMISDGIENCLQYINSFDPDKSSNPFAYFTQIIFFAFLRRIAREKKQSYIKGKLIQEIPFELFELQGHDDEGHFTNSFVDFMQQNGKFDTSFEKKKEKKIKQKDMVDLGEYGDGTVVEEVINEIGEDAQ